MGAWPRTQWGLVLAAVVAGSPPPLRLNESGTFRLVLFCDMHFGENAAHDAKSVAFERTMLRLEQPDLVVIDGDASSNYAAPHCPDGAACRDYFAKNFAAFTGPLEESKTPYAYTLGNHDRIPGLQGTQPNETSYYLSDHAIMQKAAASGPSAYSEDGPADIHGASNYVLPVLDREGKPQFYVWMLDSSDNNCENKSGWGCVYPDQVEWFKNMTAALAAKDGRVVPGMAFFHIPLPEVASAWGPAAVGAKQEAVSPFSVNTGLFSAMRDAKNILAAFSGHDHNNDFAVDVDGVTIGYGRKSGYGGYGGAVASKPGSRVLEVQVAGDGRFSWSTWIRLESGEKCTQTKQGQACGASWGDETVMQLSPVRRAAAEQCRVRDDRASCRLAAGLVEEQLLV